MFEHMILNVIQKSNVKGSKVKVTAWRNNGKMC